MVASLPIPPVKENSGEEASSSNLSNSFTVYTFFVSGSCILVSGSFKLVGGWYVSNLTCKTRKP